MTDSIVGSLPPGWEVTTLGEVCVQGGGGIQTGPFGSQLHASDYVPEGIPSIMPQNIGDNRIVTDGIARISDADSGRLRRYLVRPGDIVYSRRGDVERRALVRDEQDGWLCGTGCLRVRFGEGIVDPTYAAYYLAHPAVRAWITRHAVGATMPNLNTAILSAVPFAKPALHEQRRIAATLGALDDKIELNRRINYTLESIARAIFKSWFVHFDPVRKKMEGGEVGLPSDLAALFPSSLGESLLGQIPTGWVVDAVGELMDLRYGKSLRAQDRQPGSVPVYGSNGQVGWHDTPLVSGSGIVVGRKGNPGTVSWVQGDFFPIDTSFYVRPKRDTADLHYLYHALARLGLPSLSADSAVPGLNRESACHARLLKPPLALTTAYGSFVKPLVKRQAQFERESVRLAETRDALLPRLLDGTLHHTHQCRGVRCD